MKRVSLVRFFIWIWGTHLQARSRCSQDQDPIRRFQENQLSENDEQWHRLVPEEARTSLPEKEVKRQGVIFEIIKSEKEYVADLEALQDVSSILSRVYIL